jgi:hypothetical protein
MTKSRNEMIEPLERRQLMAGGAVIAQQFVGTVEAVSAVILTFNTPLDPATAQNPDAYEMIKKFRSSGSDGFGGFGEEESSSKNSHVPIESAVYDANANTVTLTAREPFPLRQSFTVIVARGRGPNAIMTAAGTALDGNGNGRPGDDAILRYKAGVTKRLIIREADGDRATIRIEDGPGRFLYFFAKRKRSTPSILLRETDSSTILTGEVKQGRRGDGIVDISQIKGIATIAFASDPAFRIKPDPG